MKRLLKKELALAMHPAAAMFLALSAMLLIPNYPYYVVFFYTSLGIFFTCLGGRENNDVFYSLTLPVAKADIVGARILFCVLLQMAQVALAVPFALLRQSFDMPGNQAGMDANLALIGLSLVMLGLFNYVFFSIYYKDVTKVGKAFVCGTVATFGYIVAAEACTFAVPFVRDCLDTPDTMYLGSKLLLLAAGGLVYAALTLGVYKKSVAAFGAYDL